MSVAATIANSSCVYPFPYGSFFIIFYNRNPCISFIIGITQVRKINKGYKNSCCMMQNRNLPKCSTNFIQIQMVINWPATGINWRKNQILFNCIFSTMHQVLYKGISAFHGLIPAFLNIPYKPICQRINATINKSKPILILSFL